MIGVCVLVWVIKKQQQSPNIAQNSVGSLKMHEFDIWLLEQYGKECI